MAALGIFRSDIEQIPSIYLTLKYQGKEPYECVRQGAGVPREACPIIVCELLFVHHEGNELKLEVHCPKGTYIHTIAGDLGERLGYDVHATYLCRLTVSEYPVEWMVTLEHLCRLAEQTEQQDIPAAELLDPLLMSVNSSASDYPAANPLLTSSVYSKNGNPVRTSNALLEGLARIAEGKNGEFIDMGETDDEGRIAPRRPVVRYPA